MIDDVINEVRELFLDEGVDEQVLLELKTVHASAIVLLFFVVFFFLQTLAIGGAFCADTRRYLAERAVKPVSAVSHLT